VPALDAATESLLNNGKSPSRRVGELDTRGSHFYVAMYWAQALAAQTEDVELAARFGPLAELLTTNEQVIVDELNAAQGAPMDIGGYYNPDLAQGSAAMRPSATLNAAIDGFSA